MRPRISQFDLAASLFAAMLAIGAAPSALAAEFERILTEEEFIAEIVGKRLEYESGANVIFRADGTFGGGYSGSAVTGEWTWREDRICHQINIGEKRYKVTCKVPQIMKRRVRFIREDGSTYGEAKLR